MKKLTCMAVFAALIVTVTIFLNTELTRAHSDEPHEQEESRVNSEEHNQDNLNYSYIADPGCSLSLLARRSLQLYDEQSDEVSLNEAQIIYAETNIVKETGARWLLIGEQVEIDGALVSKYAHSSQELNQASQKAWQVYARQANFNLSNINPVNPVARSEETSPDDETHNDQANSGNEVTHNESEEQEESQIASTVRTGSNTWWVLVVLVSLGLLWWITNRHDQENKA